MNRWLGVDLESDIYSFPELSGSTSVNIKVQKLDPVTGRNTISMGIFAPHNDSGNPYFEIAYFNMAAIFGMDSVFRPAIRYVMGTHASALFKQAIDRTVITDPNRLENKKRILAIIASGQPLLGCLKAKKPDGVIGFDGVGLGSVNFSHPITMALQASNPKPAKDEIINLAPGYSGEMSVLAKELSALLVLDVIFAQWDRFSGGNISLQKDAQGQAHFYFSDNGGADMVNSTAWVEKNMALFSRYDRSMIEKLKEIANFFEHPETGFLGYTNAEAFIIDLGFYAEMPTAVYLERLKRNLRMFLSRVQANEAKYGENAYFD